MRKTDLLEAMGRIDPALIEEAEPKQKKKFKVIPWIAGGLAAAILLAVLPPVLSGIGRNQSGRYLTNPWEMDGFRVVTVGHSASVKVKAEEKRYLSFAGDAEQVAAETEAETKAETGAVTEGEPPAEAGAEVFSVTVPLDASIRIESLIDDRYILYEEGAETVIYDLETGTNVNLTERVLGDDLTKTEYFRSDLIEHLRMNGWFPDAEKEPAKMKAFHSYVTDFLKAFDEGRTYGEYTGKTGEQAELDFTEKRKDPVYRDITDAGLLDRFDCAILEWRDRMITDMENGFYLPAWLHVFATDTVHGTVIYQLRSRAGGHGIFRYDLKTDSFGLLPPDRRGILQGTITSYAGEPEFVFSPDGRYLTVSYTNAAGISGAGKDDPLHPGDIIPDDRYPLEYGRYLGDCVGVFDLETGDSLCYGFDSGDGYFSDIAASTAGRLSPTGATVWYRAYLDGKKSFRIDPATFQNHRGYYPHEGDQWFFSLKRGKGVLLEGNFVRFAKDDTVVIMEKNGEYRAYDLIRQGTEITDQIKSGKTELMAHEYYALTVTDGVLTRTHLFDGSAPEVILSGDAVCLSDNGGFAFAYSSEKGSAICLNVATLETYEIAVSPDFAAELSAAGNVGFSFRYLSEENTLFLSFFHESDDHKEEGIDFFGIIKDPDFNTEPVPFYPYILPDGTFIAPTEEEKALLLAEAGMRDDNGLTEEEMEELIREKEREAAMNP